MTKILILKGGSYKSVGEMFARHGYEVLYGHENLSQVNVVVFTGGSDVSPYIYGEEPHGARGCDPIRDELEKEIYNKAQDLGLTCIGICRGGQLLNVLNCGEMIQDLGKDSQSGVVPMFDALSGEYVDVLVDHHQGILVNEGEGETYAWNEEADKFAENVSLWPDYLVIYPGTKSFCFQPHPEWGHKPTEEYFFDKLKVLGVLE